ncbi:MAG TPA: hypothetical protein VIQ53_26720 [Inquilinus sp.]
MVTKLFDAGKVPGGGVPGGGDEAQKLLRRGARVFGPSLGTLTTDRVAFYDGGWVELSLRGNVAGWCIDHRRGWQGWLSEVEALADAELEVDAAQIDRVHRHGR